MKYIGDFPEDEAAVLIPWNSNAADGASITATAITVSIYKDGGLTQKTTSNGITSTIDFDSLTGSHLVAIDTNNDTGDGGFWVTGSDYQVHIAATIDTKTVKGFIGAFSIENRTALPKADAATAVALSTAQTDLDTLTGSDGVTLATAQGNYAPNVVVPDAAGVAPTAAEINIECDLALTDYDGPTKAELDTAHSTTDGLITTVDTVVDAIKSTTDNLPNSGALNDLATILADTGELQADDVPGLIAALDAVVDTVKAETVLILADTSELQSDDLPGLIAALNNLSAANVNAEVVDVIRTDTIAELSAVPAATSSLATKINWLFMLARNKGTQTSTTKTLLADDTTTTVSTSTVSDDGTTFTREEYT